MSIYRNNVRKAVRIALLPCLTAAGLLPITAMAQTTLEEITVTARKTEETLQEVPVAITAISGDPSHALEQFVPVVDQVIGLQFGAFARHVGQIAAPR